MFGEQASNGEDDKLGDATEITAADDVVRSIEQNLETADVQADVASILRKTIFKDGKDSVDNALAELLKFPDRD
jgi:hypothetical protein